MVAHPQGVLDHADVHTALDVGPVDVFVAFRSRASPATKPPGRLFTAPSATERTARATLRRARTTGADPVRSARHCAATGHVSDKLSHAGLAAVPSQTVAAPRVDEPRNGWVTAIIALFARGERVWMLLC